MDQTILTFFNQTLAHPVVDVLMLILTYGGLALLPAGGVVLLFGRQRKLGVAILTAITVSLVFTFVLQYLALRPRPEAVRLLVPTPNFPAYPSGHAAMAFAVAMVLALAYRRKWAWILALGSAGLIAISRVYLGVHYPSDVLGGAILGAGLGAASYGLMLASPPGQPAWHWLLWPQVALVLVITQLAYLDLIRLRILTFAPMDKILHFVLFGLVVFWLNLWLEGRAIRVGGWSIPLAVLLPLLAATSEEIAQAWSPVRTASLLDWSSDLLGMLFFWSLSRRFLKTKLSGPAAEGRINCRKP